MKTVVVIVVVVTPGSSRAAAEEEEVEEVEEVVEEVDAAATLVLLNQIAPTETQKQDVSRRWTWMNCALDIFVSPIPHVAVILASIS